MTGDARNPPAEADKAGVDLNSGLMAWVPRIHEVKSSHKALFLTMCSFTEGTIQEVGQLLLCSSSLSWTIHENDSLSIDDDLRRIPSAYCAHQWSSQRSFIISWGISGELACASHRSLDLDCPCPQFAGFENTVRVYHCLPNSDSLDILILARLPVIVVLGTGVRRDTRLLFYYWIYYTTSEVSIQ